MYDKLLQQLSIYPRSAPRLGGEMVERHALAPKAQRIAAGRAQASGRPISRSNRPVWRRYRESAAWTKPLNLKIVSSSCASGHSRT